MAPAITSMAPALGPIAGGTDIFITGTDFLDFLDALIDGVSMGYSSSNDEAGNLEVHVYTDPHAAGIVALELVCSAGSAFGTFEFVEDAPPPDAIPILDGCIALAVPGGFLADGVTPDVNGIVYTPTIVGGWWDSIPLTSATAEMQPRGETITVAQELGRDIALEITAHSPIAGTPLGPLLCFTAMDVIKAAFRIIFVPVAFRVVDPFADRTLLARRVGPIKQTILGESAAVQSQIPLLGEDPRRFPT